MPWCSQILAVATSLARGSSSDGGGRTRHQTIDGDLHGAQDFLAEMLEKSEHSATLSKARWPLPGYGWETL